MGNLVDLQLRTVPSRVEHGLLHLHQAGSQGGEPNSTDRGGIDGFPKYEHGPRLHKAPVIAPSMITGWRERQESPSRDILEYILLYEGHPESCYKHTVSNVRLPATKTDEGAVEERTKREAIHNRIR